MPWIRGRNRVFLLKAKKGKEHKQQKQKQK